MYLAHGCIFSTGFLFITYQFVMSYLTLQSKHVFYSLISEKFSTTLPWCELYACLVKLDNLGSISYGQYVFTESFITRF